MKETEEWKAKVSDLKKFAEESLKHLEEDKESLFTLLQEFEDSMHMLQQLAANQTLTVMKMSSDQPNAPIASGGERMESKVVKVVRGEGIDLPGKLADQREKIPIYRSIVRHFEQNGTLLQTCLKRLTEAETFIA